MPAGQLDLYASYSANTYSAVYHFGNGQADKTYSIAYGSKVTRPSDPAKGGSTFTGWRAGSASGALWDFTSGRMPAKQLELYASYRVDSYTASFHPGNGQASKSYAIAYGSAVTKPADPARSGYTFTGWHTDTALAAKWDFATGRMPARDIALYAGWSQDPPPAAPKQPDPPVQPPAQPPAKSIASATVSAMPVYTYKGSQIKPTPVVKLGSAKLQKGRDYTLAYTKNKDIGAATVTITGKGSYTGTKKATFSIVPKKASISTVKAAKGSATVKWKKAASAQKITGYNVLYRVKGGKWMNRTLSASTAQTVVKGLKKGKTYEFRLRAYKTVGGVKYCSAWSATKPCKGK
jgi:uncharacterized repeat protein (TIGR02543 family)